MPRGFPVPGSGVASVVAPAPGPGEGSWAGAPSATLDDDGAVILAYRVRSPAERGGVVIVAREDSGRWTTLARLTKVRFGAASLERPALVRTAAGGWRLYVSCATPKGKHWRIDVLDADEPAALAAADARTAFPGDERIAVKDPVVRRVGSRWRAWVCCHPLDVSGEEDRMHTRTATSDDGLAWSLGRAGRARRAPRHVGRPRRARHRRPAGRPHGLRRARHQGGELPRADRPLRATAPQPVSDARYLDVLPLPGGGYRLFYEAPLPDGSHELRSELASGSG